MRSRPALRPDDPAFLFRAACVANGKIFIGARRGRPRDCPSYLGTNADLLFDLRLHGRARFQRHVLCLGPAAYVYDLHLMVVTQAFVDRLDTYNSTVGGNPRLAGARSTHAIRRHYWSPLGRAAFAWCPADAASRALSPVPGRSRPPPPSGSASCP